MSKIFVEDTWGIVETNLKGYKDLDFNLYKEDNEVYITFYGNFNGEVNTNDCKGHYKLVKVHGGSPLNYLSKPKHKDFIIDVFVTATIIEEDKFEGKKYYLKAKDFDDETIHSIMKQVENNIEKDERGDI